MTSGVPNHNPDDPKPLNDYVFYELPMTKDAMGVTSGSVVQPATQGGFYPGANTVFPVLKADRRLVTMFAQSGLVVTNTIEPVPPTTPAVSGEGFNIANVGYPFLRAQQGLREAR